MDEDERHAFFLAVVRFGDDRDDETRAQPSVPYTARLLDMYPEPCMAEKDLGARGVRVGDILTGLGGYPALNDVFSALALSADEHACNPLRDPMIVVTCTISVMEFFEMLEPLGVDLDWAVDVMELAASWSYTDEEIRTAHVKTFLDPVFFSTILNLAIRFVLNPDRSISQELLHGVTGFLQGFRGAEHGIFQGITAGDAWVKMLIKLGDRDNTSAEYAQVLAQMLGSEC
jgi:hypothetical protein